MSHVSQPVILLSWWPWQVHCFNNCFLCVRAESRDVPVYNRITLVSDELSLKQNQDAITKGKGVLLQPLLYLWSLLREMIIWIDMSKFIMLCMDSITTPSPSSIRYILGCPSRLNDPFGLCWWELYSWQVKPFQLGKLRGPLLNQSCGPPGWESGWDWQPHPVEKEYWKNINKKPSTHYLPRALKAFTG